MKGYKAFNSDLTCRGFQYEIGKTYEMKGNPIICERGFHFCASLADCYNFYDMSENTRICEVTAIGDIVSDDDKIKYCTNKIKIVREIRNPREKSNTSKTSSGYYNSGYYNSGNRNSGNRNSGNYNSGNYNSGYYNSGDYNSGYYNSGNRNSGNYNSGDYNSGVFNTDKNPKIKMFDKESNWTISDWSHSNACYIMSDIPCTYSNFIWESDMSDEEKENHPEYKTIGGYVKTFVATDEDKQKWWDNLNKKDKDEVLSLPNFDADKFYQCTGIKVSD